MDFAGSSSSPADSFSLPADWLLSCHSGSDNEGILFNQYGLIKAIKDVFIRFHMNQHQPTR